jgi:single-strand DNA-binding protein
MPYYNKTLLMGHLGRDPKVSHTSSGKTKVTMTLATSSYYGEGEKRTDWHNVECWAKLAENCAQYLSKGSAVLVEGELRHDVWKNDAEEYQHRYYINAKNIKFLDKVTKNEDKSDDHVAKYYDTQPAQASEASVPF